MKRANFIAAVIGLFMTVPALAQDADFTADIAEITQRITDAEKVVASYDGGVVQAQRYRDRPHAEPGR